MFYILPSHICRDINLYFPYEDDGFLYHSFAGVPQSSHVLFQMSLDEPALLLWLKTTGKSYILTTAGGGHSYFSFTTK